MNFQYALGHSFGKYTNEVHRYFVGLLNNSINYFKSQVDNNQVSDSELEHLGKIIKMQEDFLYYYFTQEPKNFEYVLKTIISNVVVIGMRIK